MKSVLVLGAGGFVGRHFSAHAAGCGWTVVRGGRDAGEDWDVLVDVLDPTTLDAAISRFRPSAIVNLAGFASVGDSFAEPRETFLVNALGVLNVVEAARAADLDPYILIVSSGEIYGDLTLTALPATEGEAPAPASPYAASKVAAEAVCASFAHRGARIGIARAFNHVGPGQSERFIASSFARQVSRTPDGEAVSIETGNLDLIRDFTDVRDVVRAYGLMVSAELEGVYNVCSGKGRKLSSLVACLEAVTGRTIRTTQSESRLRAYDPPIQIGSFQKLYNSVRWEPSVSLDQTIIDLYRWWQEGDR